MTKKTPEADPWAVAWTIRGLIIIAFVAAFAVPLGFPIISVADHVAQDEEEADQGPITVLLNTPVPTPTPQVATPTPNVTRVGIIAGHLGSDTGAICPDGLQEVDINLDIATQVVNRLSEGFGWQVELLEEFDDQLNGYSADALLSIHADSCNIPGRSGFKMARAESSYIPGPEDRLVDCVSRHYHEVTGLAFDRYTITYDMTRYHAYYEIDPNTPAAILEAGFMLEDRELLTEHSDRVAEGIVNGLICFVEGEGAIP
jgi:N-acetylmuramoyl-L-alanine amidase